MRSITLPGSPLESVRGLANELIEVDTGSTDATARVAAEYGAKVIPFDFTRGDFAGARNIALAERGVRLDSGVGRG